MDARAEFDPDGSKRREQQDTNDDGKYDVTILYENGKKVRVEEDTNADGKPDVVTIYDGDRIARREADTDHDGRFDTVAIYEKGIEAAPGARQERRRQAGARDPARRTRREGPRGGRHQRATVAPISCASSTAASACARRRTRRATASPRS